MRSNICWLSHTAELPISGRWTIAIVRFSRT